MDATAQTVKQPFSEAELEQLHALTFKRPSIARLLDKGTSARARAVSLECEFDRYLLRLAAPKAHLYDAIMRKFNGDPSGVEFKADNREAWAFILPDASEPGRMRVQYFDRNSFFSHHPYDTVAECVDALVAEGYTTEDAGALDRLSDTDQWRRGVEVAGLIQMLNAKEIDHEEFNRRVIALSPAKAAEAAA